MQADISEVNLAKKAEKLMNNAKKMGFLEVSRFLGVKLAEGFRTRLKLTATANELGKELASQAAPLLERQGNATCEFVKVIHRAEHTILISRIEADTEVMEATVEQLRSTSQG